MKHLKTHIEKRFEQWARISYRHPLMTLTVLITITIILLVQMKHLAFDTSSEALLHESDPYRIEYDRLRETFGQDRSIILAISSQHIFSETFLKKLKALHRDIEASVPYLKNVDSLLTARCVSGKDDTLQVDELLASWPEKAVDMKALRRRVMANPFYRDHFISKDGTMTAIVIKTQAVIVDEPISDADIMTGFSDGFETDPEPEVTDTHFISAREIREIVAVLETIISEYQADDFDIGFTGSPVVVDVFNRAVATDMTRCALLAMAAIILVMIFLFRRISGVFIPLMVVIMSVVSTLGIMAVLNVNIKIMTAILPVFILCVGVADSVHVLSAFFREYRGSTTKEDAIARAMNSTALAVLLTSLTTAAGLLSFAFAEISAIGEMGIFSAIGVVIALAYTICMLPPILALLPLKPEAVKNRRSRVTDRILAGFAAFSVSHPKKIIIGSVILLLVVAAYLPRLRYVDHMLNYFSDHMKVKHDIIRIDKKMSGIISFEAIIDTGEENGLHDPEILNRIERLADRLKNDPEIRRISRVGIQKVFSIVDIIKEINQALNDDDPLFYVIPDERRMIAQELFLFENSGRDELEPIVDTAFSKTRVSIKVPWLDSMGLYQLSLRIRHLADDIFTGHARINLTGMSVILARTLPATLTSMKESYILAAVVISVLMIFLAGNIKTGLVAMFPNLLPILTIMGGLAMLDIPLDMTSLMIGSIAIGLVVDDTMHFIHHFRRHFDQTRDARKAVHNTLLGTGRALLITTLVLTGGFLALTMAEMPNLSRFGILLAITLVLALMADFILAPALMVMAAGHGTRNVEDGIVPIRPGAGALDESTFSDSTLPKQKNLTTTKGENRHAV